MKLSEVKYQKCKCGRIYPMAHWIKQSAEEFIKLRPNEYVAHQNPICNPCARSFIEKLDKKRENGSKLSSDEVNRYKKLERMVTQ